ncbi:MAG: Flp pilus assembly protein CpaB [Pigmentiphaga sp.]|uniref:Flp pilus assembly protein CpaB n=1 Tax=Pigmentiphaga sp. TaxID=1977564 RepID=UPI0029A08384|nr:Flp pilus assembly protein CpaB [Pigmentiphaga sp.]MDX3907737.1 Flp pilus assembly protein CpaB [Pigmentiphaga sp.]
MNNVTKIVAAMLVLLAVLLGGYAFILANKPPQQAKPVNAPTPLAEKKTPVVVADKLLPAGVPIEAGALKVVDLPIDPAGSYRDVGALAGKIPKFDIGPGTPVTESSLVKGLTLLLSEGERAVAVPVDEVVGTGNRVSPGDFVDVFFTLKQGQDVNKTQARLLLSRLRVLTYGSASAAGDAPADDGATPVRNNNPAPVARTAVLAVPTADVNRLLLATQNGKLQLVLRNPTDTTAPDVSLFPEPPPVLAGKSSLTKEQREALEQADNQAYAGLELTGLSGGASARPAPAARARPRQPAAAPRAEANTVEVVRGTKREVVGF